MKRYVDLDEILLALPKSSEKLIRDWPLADVVEKRHGKWKEHSWAEEVDGFLISNFECSYCHEWVRNKTPYCPQCGAEMVNYKFLVERKE